MAIAKYGVLDKAILAKIGDQQIKMAQINTGEVAVECSRIAAAESKEAFRILDRRLQALRKAGRIQSSTKGWVRVTA